LIDLHSHILPGIDDGARTMDDALALARHSVRVGVSAMVCTPHIHIGTFDNDYSSIKSTFDYFLAACKAADIPLMLSFAAEVRICPEVVDLAKENSLPFIGQFKNKDALLLELPHSHIPAGSDTLIKWLLNNGIFPIIPHPERNREIQADYKKLNWLKNIGCAFQITAGSLTGTFKSKARQLAWYMLENDMVAYVASDLHNIHKRPNEMKEAYELISQRFGVDRGNALFYKVPKLISQNLNWENTSQFKLESS